MNESDCPTYVHDIRWRWQDSASAAVFTATSVLLWALLILMLKKELEEMTERLLDMAWGGLI